MFELYDRTMYTKNWYYFVIVLSFSLIALSRLSQRRILMSLFGMLVKAEGIRSYIRETNAFNPLSSILLSVNFILTTGFFTYQLLLSSDRNIDIYSWQKLTIVLLPFIYFLLNFLFLIIIGWLSGEQFRLRSLLDIEFSTILTLGVLLSFFLLFYLMGQNLQPFILKTVVVLFTGSIIWRILRSSYAAWSEGVYWYYIILYLCTLEILPLTIVYDWFR